MATQPVSRGVDVRLIQEFLGHADIRSTGRYAKVLPKTLLGVLRPPRATSGRQVSKPKNSTKPDR
jgi:site-specific recombinase XerD